MAVTSLKLLFSSKPLTISLNKIDIALLVFYAYYFVRAATTPYMPMIHNQRFVNWTLCVILYFFIKGIISKEQDAIEYNKKSAHTFLSSPIFNFSSIVVNGLILTGLGQAIWGFLQLYGFLPSFNANFKITGTFFNPAPYAIYLAFIFPMALSKVLMNNEQLKFKKVYRQGKSIAYYIKQSSNYFILNHSQFSNFLSLATIIAILLILPATMVRAAWLGGFAGSLVIFQYKYGFIQKIRDLLNTPFKMIGAVIIWFTLVAVVGVSGYLFKKDSADGKLFIWEVTFAKVIEKPLFGYGVGRFEAEYNSWQAEYFQNHPMEMEGQKGWVAGNTKYCFNEFLEMTSEIGIVGLCLFFTMIVLTVWRHKVNSNTSTLFHSSLLISGRATLVSTLVIAGISFPFYNISILPLFFIILAINSSRIP